MSLRVKRSNLITDDASQAHNKIYWHCFKRQLEELYFLLYSEKFISCDADEFISHFTGKKFRIDNMYNGRLIWNKEKYLLMAVIHHLTEKKFIDADPADTLKKHFNDIPDSVAEEYKIKKNKKGAKNLQAKLVILFPIETGYRCKQRLYYRARNKEGKFVIEGAAKQSFSKK